MEKIFYIVLGSVLVNFLLGVLIHIGKDFKIGVLFEGIWIVVKKEIALVVLMFGYWYFADLEVLQIAYAPIFYFLYMLSVVYHLNSILVNVCAMLGFEDVKVIGELDRKFKELMNRSLIGDQ